MASYIKTSLERAYAETFLADLESNTNQYFLFIGGGLTWENGASDNTPPVYTDTVASEYAVMNQIIGYKKLNPQNVIFALPRNLWASGTKYDQYDDSVDLSTKKYYVVTEDNHIYKCLANGGGAASTVKPSLLTTSPFTISDGYKWKYMATVKESNLPYELTDYVPIEYEISSLDTETQNQYNTQITAVGGAIDRMTLSYPTGTPTSSFGVYPNTRTVANTGRPIGIEVNKVTKISPTRKTVTVTESASRTSILNNANLSNYVNYIMKVQNTSPDYITEKNNYGVIVDVSQAANEIVFTVENDVVDFNFTEQTNQIGSQRPVGIEILPYLKIVGNGSGCYAFPIMDSSNRITGVDVINGGKNYSSSLVEVVSAKNAGTVHPILTPVLSPKGGHGSNVLKELGVKDVLVIVEITEEDSQKIMGGGKYRQFGIIKNPILSDGTGIVAGKQEQSYRDIELLPTIGSINPSHFDLSDYNFIIGSESFASSKIVSLKSVGSNVLVLKTLNTSGNFISRLDRPSDYLVGVSSNNEDVDALRSFQIGETVTQTVPANTPFGTAALSFGFDFTVSGKIVAKTTDAIVVRITSGANFVVSSTNPVVGDSSKTSATVFSVSPRYGEEVWVSNNQGGAASFVKDDFGNQKLYKISSISQGYFNLDTVPSYSGLHVLDLRSSLSGISGGMDTTSAPLSQSSFSNGDRIHQGLTGQFAHYATGTVYYWDYVSPAHGKLYLTNVYGSFRSVAKHGLSGSQLQSFVVADVTPPEILATSGEVVYINNVRPIDRTLGQQEEFRIRLGF